MNEDGEWAGLSRGSQSIVNKAAKQTAYQQLLKLFGGSVCDNELQRMSDKFKVNLHSRVVINRALV